MFIRVSIFIFVSIVVDYLDFHDLFLIDKYIGADRPKTQSDLI